MPQLLLPLIVAMRLEQRAGMVVLGNSPMDFSTSFSLLCDCGQEPLGSDDMDYYQFRLLNSYIAQTPSPT